MNTQEINIEEFLPSVIPYVKGVPDVVAYDAIRDSIEEFCKRSTLVRIIHEPVTIVPEVAEYNLDIPYHYYSVAIIQAGIGNWPLPAMDTDTITLYFGPDWRYKTGPVSYITQDDPRSFTLAMVPARTYVDPIYMTVAVAPTKEATSVRKIIFDNWSEVIAFGARARLHDTPDAPYYDPQQAIKFRAWFDSGCSEAKITADKGYGKNAAMHVRPRFV